MIRYAVRLAVAVLVAAAVGLGVPGPAQAAACRTSSGVTVVVDFHQLGGGVQTACDLHGGTYAADQFVDVGHALTYAQRQPGFVCRVDGTPSSDPCIATSPADAYWSLWWSDGKSGQWSFSSLGVGSLKVPAGGYVALSWQGSSGRAAPRVTPAAHPSAPTSPTAPPTHRPSSPTSGPTTAPPTSPTSGPTSPATSSATPSATPPGHHRSRHHPRHHRGRHHAGDDPTTASPSPGDSAEGSRATDPVEDGGSGLPGWVAPGLVGLVFVAAAAVVVVRRNGSGGS